ncbi:TPA: neutral zinc metallopeptidase, partial [Streptococcus suis]|nr:neutral zinc metallopeptidase [Streptococcus suis]
EDFWTQEFARNGLTYQAPTLVFYTDQTQTGCGVGSAQAGPFYCSADRKIYIDTSFYQELSSKYKAAGDFAMAYVIAHEVGHHVQNELEVLGAYHQKRAQLSDKEGNALNVRLELQADYYAGAWAKYVDGQGILDAGDIDEAMNAAHAVGDDTLQQEAYGRTVPDSFTHGTSEQRKKWFNLGYTYGDLAHADTFSVENP